MKEEPESFSEISQIQTFIQKNKLLNNCSCCSGVVILTQAYGSRIKGKEFEVRIYCIKCGIQFRKAKSLKIPINAEDVKKLCEIINDNFFAYKAEKDLEKQKNGEKRWAIKGNRWSLISKTKLFR